MRGGPACRILLLAVFFRIVQRAAQQGMQVLVVRLDYVERGGNAAIALRNDKHGGTRCLFRLNLCGFGLLPVQVKRAFLDIAYHEVIVFHGSQAVHKILVHLLFSFMVNNTPAKMPANTPVINVRIRFGRRFSTV